MSKLRTNLLIIIPLLLAFVLVFTSVFVMVEKNFESEEANADNIELQSNVSSELIPLEEFKPQFGTYVKKTPLSVRSVTIVPGVDFLLKEQSFEESMTEIDSLLKSISDDKFNTVNVVVNTQNTCIFDAEGIETKNGNVLGIIYSIAHTLKMNVITTVDLGLLADNNITDEADNEKICKILASENLLNHSDMLLLDGYYLDSSLFSEQDINGTHFATVEAYAEDKLNQAIYNFCTAIVRENSKIYIGVRATDFFTDNEETKEKDYSYFKNGNADIKLWAEKKYIDYIFASIPHSIDDKSLKFKTCLELWETEFKDICDLYFEVTYSLYGSDNNWKKPDVIVEQLIEINKNHGLNFNIDSFNAYNNDKTESKPAVQKYIKGEMLGNYILKDLSISAPSKLKFTTYEDTVAILGASDPEFSLTLNGQPLERNELGYFSIDCKLELGENVYKIVHKGVTKTFKITYKKVVIKEVSPTDAVKLEGGSSFVASVVALAGSTVTATLNDSTITLVEDPIYDDFGNLTEYSNYDGLFILPVIYDENKNIGKISFKAVSSYGTETKNGGNVTILKSERPVEPTPPDQLPLPEGGDYVDVGYTHIAEVIADSAETFYIDDKDRSRPTNNYLPKGTVDYCSKNVTEVSGVKLRTLRYGRTVYDTHKGEPPIKVYEGSLPDHNEIGIAEINNGSRYTTITLNTLWKAPFLFDLKEQEYRRNKKFDGTRDFTVEQVTFSYIDITFTYATVATGEISFNENPVFSHGEWIKNPGDYTLRLFLKKVGGLYGWTANYNEQNQLVFSFLNPQKITVDETNKYGYSLKGLTIVVDAGHGGKDPGSYGYIKDPIEINGEKIKVYEHYLNLMLAKKLKAELESMGATVIMTRSDNDTTLTDHERIAIARDAKPDFIVSIHRNGSSSSEPHAFNTYHFNAFSANATEIMYDATANANLYEEGKWSGVKSHVFFMSRMTDCPVVLTENGFMTNKNEFEKMIQDEFNQECAIALAQGVLNYFISIQ